MEDCFACSWSLWRQFCRWGRWHKMKLKQMKLQKNRSRWGTDHRMMKALK
ncbi:MAG: hypothetical protein NUK54_08225 [Methanothrix sp.]|nr:hypothetical protein [Methanothrix sp.]